MLFLMKFSIYFLLSFIILSISFENRPLFFHLTKIMRPYSGDVINSATEISNSIINETKKVIDEEKKNLVN